jgi:hypothetical protein
VCTENLIRIDQGAEKGGPSGQSWSAFLRNHAPQIAAMDGHSR